MKIPIYDMVVNLDDSENMMTTISLVTDPAVEVPFLYFDKNEKQMKFDVSDEEKHCITGVAIRCDIPIYRYSPDMGEYYVRFSKETIENIVYKYSKMNLWNSVSLEHSGHNIADAVMVEYFIKGNGKNPSGFEDIEDGSLFVTYKITNDELWDTIKNTDEINGFSIEVFADLEPTKEYIEDNESEPDEMSVNPDFWAELLEWLGEEDVDVVFEQQKKKFKRVTQGEVQEIMGKNRKVNITIGKRTLYEQQIFQLGEGEHGKGEIVVYDPQTRDWNTYDLTSISYIEVTDLELENYDFNAKWKSIVEDNTLGILDTSIGHSVGNTFDDAIDTNRMVMIDYFDEVNDDGMGFRSCLVTSLGYTTGSDGTPRNQAIRVFEYSGASHEGLDGGLGNWRFMLTRRIRDFKIVDYAEPIMTPPIGYNGEAQQDSGRNGTMSNVTNTMQFPPRRKS